MSETLSFPGLGLEFTLNRVAFHIGSFTIYWYGIIIAVAFLAGITYGLYRVKTFGLDGDRVIDVILGGSLGAVAGARLYYVAFSWAQYKDDWVSIFKIWEGGIAIYGGIIGGFLVGFLMCRIRKVKFLPMADLGVSGIILGQAIGRWGNFVNVEAFGGNTSLPWGMTSPGIVSYLRAHISDLSAIHMEIDPTLPVHPTFLYESIWCLIGFILIALYTKHRRFDGEIVLFYAAWYGAGRAVIEGLRTDSLLIGTLRVSQAVAVVCVVVSLLAWVAIRSRLRRSGDPDELMLFVHTPEGQAVLDGTFYTGKEAREADPPSTLEIPDLPGDTEPPEDSPQEGGPDDNGKEGRQNGQAD